MITITMFTTGKYPLKNTSQISPPNTKKNVKIKMYKTVILLVLYGCETRSVVLREEHRLTVSEQGAEKNILN
jgi:hypothetical protein